jgi:hypothetical protein
MVDVTALGMRTPDPAFLGRTSALPRFFKYEPDSRSHGKYTACCSCFALSYSSSVPLRPVRSSEPRTYVCSISGRAAVAGNTEKSSLCSRIPWPCLLCSHVETGCLTCTHFVTASDEPTLTNEQTKRKLRRKCCIETRDDSRRGILGDEPFLKLNTACSF